MTDSATTSALFTDFYELTMAQAFHAEGMNDTAVFEMFFRTLPAERNFIVAAGIEDVLDFLHAFRFSAQDTDYLAGLGHFSPAFLDYLGGVRFSGEVLAVAEGTPVFPNEPVLQVVAPLIEAQLIETCVLNQIHFQSVAASKAARVVLAAGDCPVVDFGARRAHGIDAANKAACAGYLAGLAGTSNVLMGRRHNIPLYGTMAHSYIQSHDSESAALAAFMRQYPGTTMLVDTYDTLAGIRKLIDVVTRSEGALMPGGIRIDSGDLAGLSRAARRMLDAAGLRDVKIFVSGGLTEEAVAQLAREAPVDAFGVGTGMVVSADRPSLDCAYKLVDYAGRPRTKMATSKTLWPGRKQVFRRRRDGVLAGDTLALCDERCEGAPLLAARMRDGRRLAPAPPLADRRAHCQRELAALPASLRALAKAATPYEAEISGQLRADYDLLRRELAPAADRSPE